MHELAAASEERTNERAFLWKAKTKPFKKASERREEKKAENIKERKKEEEAWMKEKKDIMAAPDL